MQDVINCRFREVVRSRISFPRFVVFSYLVVFTMLSALGAASPALAAADSSAAMEGTLDEFDGIWIQTSGNWPPSGAELLVPAHPRLPPVPDEPSPPSGP